MPNTLQYFHSMEDHTVNAWHVYARYYNFGDHALGIGLRNIFLKYFKSNILFKTFDIHTLEIDEEFIKQLNADADLLIVGGGGLIHGFAGDKWMLHLPDELIQKIKIPIMLYGLGYNQFRGERELDPKIINNLKLLKDYALAFSVRNDRSKEELKKFGLKFDEVADPGFFVDTIIPPIIKEKYVAIQLAYDMKENREINEDTMVNNYKNIVNYLLKKGYKVVFCPHVRKDCEIIDMVIKAINKPAKVFSWDWYEMIREGFTTKGLSYYKHASFVIGMRGHAQICPIGMGTPVISVISHRKNIDLLRKLKLVKYSVELNDEKFIVKMIKLIDDVEKNNLKIRRKYATLKKKMEKDTKKYLKVISKKYSLNIKNLFSLLYISCLSSISTLIDSQ